MRLDGVQVGEERATRVVVSVEPVAEPAADVIGRAASLAGQLVVVEPLGEEKELGWEACLSVPGLAGQVPRYTAVRYRGWTPKGEEVLREAQGFHARVVQHECDHLDGILYPQRMSDLSTLMFTSEMGARARAEAEEE